jgi:3-oxoacyl-[acyl-carrier protein] reductase
MQTVLITGAGIGIGRATALAFGAAGYHVVVTDILEVEGKDTAGEISARGGSAEFHSLDVRSTVRCNEIVADIESRHGAVDCLVNNAGIAHRITLDDLTDEKWDHTFDIDLKGMMRLARAVAPAMKARQSGNIICLSSIMGVAYGWDEHIHYSAAKSGVVGLVRGLAVELGGHGIRVNGLAPGYIRTAQALSVEHSVGPDALEAAAEYIPLKRIGEADDIADVALFLASSAARYVTGQVITVDGGLVIGRY